MEKAKREQHRGRIRLSILILWTMILTAVCVLIGRTIWQYLDFRTNPAVYALNSAPWYTGALIEGVLTLVFVLLCLIALLILKKKLRDGEEREQKNRR